MEIVNIIVLVSFVILLVYLKQQKQIEDLKKQNKALRDSIKTVHKFYQGDFD